MFCRPTPRALRQEVFPEETNPGILPGRGAYTLAPRWTINRCKAGFAAPSINVPLIVH